MRTHVYDRISLTDEIADAINRSASGEVSVRWRTHNGRRVVELTKVASWDLVRGSDEVEVRATSRAAENAEAVLVYLRSVAGGTPLSERGLARRFGRSKGWARDRIHEATAKEATG